MFGSHQGCEAALPTPCSIRSLFLARQRIYMDFFLPSKWDRKLCQLLCVLIAERLLLFQGLVAAVSYERKQVRWGTKEEFCVLLFFAVQQGRALSDYHKGIVKFTDREIVLPSFPISLCNDEEQVASWFCHNEASKIITEINLVFIKQD